MLAKPVYYSANYRHTVNPSGLKVCAQGVYTSYSGFVEVVGGRDFLHWVAVLLRRTSRLRLDSPASSLLVHSLISFDNTSFRMRFFLHSLRFDFDAKTKDFAMTFLIDFLFRINFALLFEDTVKNFAKTRRFPCIQLLPNTYSCARLYALAGSICAVLAWCIALAYLYMSTAPHHTPYKDAAGSV